MENPQVVAASGPEESLLTTHCRSCPLCEAHCGTVVTVDRIAKRIIGVRGDPDDPFSKGYICAKAYAVKELYHDPDVVKTPLIKKDGKFEEASWDEALDYTARRLNETRDRYGADSIGFYIGNPTAHHPGLLLYSPVLLEALGTKQIYCAGSVDIITRTLSSLFMFGDCSLTTVPDIDRTDMFVVHGGNPVVSNGSMVTAPGMSNRIKAVRARGGRIVVIDPRRTETAELADQYIPVKPGTDAYLLFAVIHHLFESGRVNLGSVGQFTKGLDTIRDLALEFSPEAVASVCGVPADIIRNLSTDFATATSAVWYGRTGTCTQIFGTLCCWLQHLINILTGNLDRPGGAMFPVGIVPSILYAEKFVDGKPPFDRWRSRVAGLPELSGVLPTAALADEILEPGEGQIRAFITMAGNPALSLPNGDRLTKAFRSLDFMVSLDIYINETTRHADVILPSPAEATHSNFDLYFIPYMVRKIAKWNPAIFELEPGQRNDWDIFLGLTARLTGSSEKELDEALVSSWLRRFCAKDEHGAVAQSDISAAREAIGKKPGPDRLLDILVRTGSHGDKFGSYPEGLSLGKVAKSPHGLDLGGMEPQLPGLLATPDGQIDLAPGHIVADVERLRLKMGEISRTDSLLLIGRRQVRSNNSWMHNLHVLTKGKERCTLMMNAFDAAQAGVHTGDMARVSSSVGAIKVAVEVTDQMMRGVVSVPHGWGHGLEDTKLGIARNHAGANANALIDDRLFDVPSINAMLNGIPVSVERLEGSATKSTSHSL